MAARSYESYVKHLRVYGVEGLLEAAKRDLSEAELGDLTKLVEAQKPSKRPKKGRK